MPTLTSTPWYCRTPSSDYQSLTRIIFYEILFRAHDWKVEWATETLAAKEKTKKKLEQSPESRSPQKAEKRKYDTE